MRVLLLNNYEMDEAWAEWQQGLVPAHHLWGASHLPQYGIEVRILPFERFRPLNRYWRLQRAVGLTSRGMIALDQQLRALGHLRVDVIYAACQDHTFLLARLRRLGVLRKPIVSVIHHPIVRGSVEEGLLDAHDLLLCLSRTLREEILARHAIPPERIVVVDWAPDLDFYGPYCPYGRPEADAPPVIVSAGKTNRDYDCLIESARGLRCRLDLYCSTDSAPVTTFDPMQVQIHVGARGARAVNDVDLRDIYRNAYAIAIPMPRVDRLAGLTSLLDAMALGRPVIMTRNAYIDIDIEQQGFGRWVEPGDVTGWRRSLSDLLSDPRRASEMGRRAREAAEQRHNLEAFSEAVARALFALRTGARASEGALDR